MKNLSSPNNSWHSQPLWLGIVSAGVVVLGFSIVDIFTVSVSRVAVIAASAFVAVLTSRHRIRLPGTDITFSAKDVFGFWGVIWLGVAGGIVLATCASLAEYSARSAERRRTLSVVATDILSTFFSASAFYISLQYFQGNGQVLSFAGLAIPSQTILASCVMAAIHLSQRCALLYLLEHNSYRAAARKMAYRLFLVPSVATVLSLIATIVIFVIFNHFGIEFGLIIIPLAVIGHLSHQIHLRRLEQKTKLITEASRIHLATVEALATAIDARDQVGIGHVRRTQIYAVGLGNILGLSEDDINALRTGALLHDIGKLAVPDHILNKPGRLTPAEMEKTKTHSLVGASILEKVGFPYPVVPTVKYHHEFWDGSGYPDGLQAGNIPLTARILAIADAYDTLRGARPYRPAVSKDEACIFLRARAGSQFDPKLVDLFLRNLKIFETEINAQQLNYETDRNRVNAADLAVNPSYVEQIKRANREVFTLYSLAREFSSALDLDEVLLLFTDKIRELVPFETSVVYLLDDANETAFAACVEGDNKEILLGKRISIGEGATGNVLKTGLPAENADPDEDFKFSVTDFWKDYRAMASLPLIANDKLIGAISLYSRELQSYQEEHLRLLETVSRIAADAIGKSLEHAVTENYALTDPMTGLPNARSLQMHFDREVKRASRNQSSFQLLVLDLDGFKAVNDTYGHKAGDKMLKEIGGVIKTQLREYDFLARYGGDEFVAIVPDTDSNDVLELARRIEDAVVNFTLSMGESGIARVGVSIGTACYPIHGENFDQIIISADKAMYLTKSFHRKKNAATTDKQPASRPVVSLPEEIVDFAKVKAVTGEGLILEVDETHIVSSTAVN